MRLILCLMLLPLSAFSQTISNIRLESSHDKVWVLYDLQATAPQDVSIVFVSDTKGTIVPNLISGALSRVAAGVNHRIDWEALKDVGAFEGDLYAELSFDMHRMREEAPSMRSEKPNPQKQQESTPISQRALFPEPRSQEKSGQNEAAGRIGSRDEKRSPDFSLQGRNLLTWHKPNDDTQLQGVVVLNVIVNLQGQVVQAVLNTKKSTIIRPDLIEKCKLSARKFKFSVTDNQTAPPLQSGTITFRFELD